MKKSVFNKKRFKILGEIKSMAIHMPLPDVLRVLKDWKTELRNEGWNTDTGLYAELRKRRVLCVYYRFQKNVIKTTNIYNNYYVLAEITEAEGDTCLLRYAFVQDKMTRLIYKTGGLVYLFFPFIFGRYAHSAPIIVISIFFAVIGGLVLFFMKSEKQEEAAPVTDLFEKSVTELFEKNGAL